MVFCTGIGSSYSDGCLWGRGSEVGGGSHRHRTEHLLQPVRRANPLRGLPFYNMDMRLGKDTRISENKTLLFSADSFYTSPTS